MITPARLFVVTVAVMLLTACNHRSGGDYGSDLAEQQADSALSLYRSGADLSREGKLGEAAVAFTRGLEMARDNELYMVEGECARGLYLLYARLFDGPNQVKYAREACEAFRKSGDADNINRAEYDLASACNNAGLYGESIALAGEVGRKAAENGDTALFAEAARLTGLSQFASGDNRRAIESYLTAWRLDSTVLTANDRANLLTAVEESGVDSAVRSTVGRMQASDDIPFELLAAQGRYEEAYRGLDRYRTEQDSILSTLLSNNVSGALNSYARSQELLRRERLKNERLLWGMIVMVIVVVSVVVIYMLRRNLREKERRQEAIISAAEHLRADLRHQLEANSRISGAVRELFRQKYAVVDTLCAAYYESKGLKHEKKRIVAEVERLMGEFSDTDKGFDRLSEYADRYTDGAFTAFRNDFPKLRNEDYRLFLYMIMGLGARSISLLLDEKIEVVYNRKSRLKARIRNSDVARRDEYIALCDGGNG